MESENPTSAYVVMSNPPEIGASHPVEVCFDEGVATDKADEVAFGYVKNVPVSESAEL